MYDRIRDFTEKHSLLYSSQYGFCKAHSTQLVETIQTNMEKNSVRHLKPYLLSEQHS